MSAYGVLCYQCIIFCALSMFLSNSNCDVIKWRGSGKCHIEMVIGKTGDVRYSVTIQTPDRIVCHSNRYFDLKSSSARFEGNGRMWWIITDCWVYWWCLKSFTAANVNYIRCCKVLLPLKGMCCHRWRTRKANIFYVLSMGSGRTSTLSFKAISKSDY
jgi:hypothetical protein